MEDRREVKPRVKTGCLTCRARRIKCDEAKPECHRCRASNVECRGYDQKRRIVTERPRAPNSTHAERDVTVDRTRDDSAASPTHFAALRQPDGMPLVALPSNPRPLQRPHDGARQILAYHQYIFRTVSVIAPPAHLWWWRDYLCKEAWDLEYLYSAIIALGTIHRAVVLLSRPEQASQRHGQDTIVVAMRLYTKALEQLSSFLEERDADSITISSVLLLAYFECFAGNIPATYRHVRVAACYYSGLSLTDTNAERTSTQPITSCLKALGRICRTAVPLLRFDSGLHLEADESPVALENQTPCTIHLTATCPCQTLHELLNLGSSSFEAEQLIWNPIGAFDTSISLEKVKALQDEVRNWMRSQTSGVSNLYPDDDDEICTADEHQALDLLCIPPEAHPTVSRDASLLGALYEFYLARIEWKLCFLTDDNIRHDLLAYLHCHRAMTWVETASTTMQSEAGEKSTLLPFERLNGGFLPILYLLGQMSPRTEWLRCIIGQMKSIGREGLIDGKAWADSLAALPVFEMCNTSDIPSLLDCFPSPTARSLSILVPDCQGDGHTAYYARPISAGNSRQDHSGTSYYVFGSARWSSKHEGLNSKPEFLFSNQTRDHDVPLDDEWLRSKAAEQGWSHGIEYWGFALELALADHRNGSLLRQVLDAVY